MKNILFLIMLIKAMVLYLRIRYLGITYFLDIILHLHIAYILKGNCFFFFVFFFYCLVLVNPMLVSPKCIDLLLCTVFQNRTPVTTYYGY